MPSVGGYHLIKHNQSLETANRLGVSPIFFICSLACELGAEEEIMSWCRRFRLHARVCIYTSIPAGFPGSPLSL